MEEQVLISRAVELIRERQIDLEARIARTINDELRAFEQETDLIAIGLKIDWVNYKYMEDRQGRYIVTGVELQWST